MPNVDDHGLEVIKKSARDIGPTPKRDYALQFIIKNSDIILPVNISSVTNPIPVTSDILYTITRTPNQSVSYIGRNKTQFALETSATWQVERRIQVGNDYISAYADNGLFTQTFNNPASLFPDPPYINQYSLNFSSGGKNINIPDNASLNFGRLSPWTYSFWGLSQNTSSYTWISKVSSGVGYTIEKKSTGKIEVEFRGTGGLSDRIFKRSSLAVPEITSGSWYHLVLTYNGSGAASGLKLYINAIEVPLDIVTDGLITDPINNSTLTIGSNVGGGNYYYAGLLDEVCLWNTNLNLTNIQGLYNNGVPIDPRLNLNGYTLSGNLVSFWPFTEIDRTNLPTIRDNQGTNHGTSSNVVTGNFFTEVAP